MEPYGILRGVDIPKPTYTIGDLPTHLKGLPYYSNLKTYIPPMKTLFSLEDISNQEVWLNNEYKITNVNIVNEEERNNCKIQVLYKTDIKQINAYLKVTHLIDPIVYVKKSVGNYDYTTDEEMKKKINDPWNQAYVETIASYCLGKLREENVSPHFNLYYGAFRSIAKKYSYNIADEIESYRMYKWFWNGIEKQIMKIHVDIEDEDERRELYDEIMKKPDYPLEEDNDEIEVLKCDPIETAELHSLDSISIETRETIEHSEEEEDEEEEDDDEETKVYLNLSDFPVMMIFTEKNTSTMDDLLEDYMEVGAEPGEKLWEEKWTAWIFQVIAALCVAQTIFGFTHNDLHSSNIVWSSTDKPHLYYKSKNKFFKVPTYGKIFKIIDFGRSIFSINDSLFVSDDFRDENDAATQYTFPPLINDSDREIVLPNPSFDLTRLSISIFETLFPEKPDDRKTGILSEEEGRVVRETKSDLYNLLWTWLIDSDGNNILWDDEDDERFPDFELYVHIAAKCKNAIPKEQITKKAFQQFDVIAVPKNATVYSLFV